MTKKPTKTQEAEIAAGAAEAAQEAQVAPSTGHDNLDMQDAAQEALPEAAPEDGENEIEAEEVEPDPVPEPDVVAQGADPVAQSVDPDASGAGDDADHDDPQPPAEPTAEQLGALAQMISEMLVWERPLLVQGLVLDHGMVIDRSIEGVRITMAGITSESPIIGPGGEHHALDNWGNAARRKILELEAAA